jgi:hypothetical protein
MSKEKENISIAKMKEALVENSMCYLTDLVIEDRYNELYNYVETHFWSDFESMDDNEIVEQYGWLTEHNEEDA